MNETILSTRNLNTAALATASRRPLDGAQAKVPDGTVIVSADSHWGLAEDPWKGRVPAHLAGRMPSMFWDEARGIWNLSIGGKAMFDGYVASIFRKSEGRAGVAHMAERLRDLDADGIDREIVFPQYLMMFFRYPDLEVREWIFRAYNEYLAELLQRGRGRHFGVGFINFWDPARAVESIRHAKDLGLKTFMVPIQPGNNAEGKPIHYAAPEYDPLWAAAQEAGLPIYFHVQEALNVDIPGGIKAFTLQVFAPFRKSFSELVFGGILDRHPDLKIVFAEAGINWVPGMLQDAEMIFDSYDNDEKAVRLKHRPTDYWSRNCYATFQRDKIGLELLDYIGADRVLWAQDYPHAESTVGYTKSAIEEIVEAVTESEAKQILGGTAIELFDLA
jgi:predicted TIM-barrel fold metal-dependent hydrolase